MLRLRAGHRLAMGFEFLPQRSRRRVRREACMQERGLGLLKGAAELLVVTAVYTSVSLEVREVGKEVERVRSLPQPGAAEDLKDLAALPGLLGGGLSTLHEPGD